MSLLLPADLVKDGVTLTANTPSDYWDLRWKGFVPAEESDELSPQQRAAITRKKNQQRNEDNSQEGHTEPEGDATGDES